MLLFYRFLQNLSSPAQPSSLNLFPTGRHNRSPPVHVDDRDTAVPPPGARSGSPHRRPSQSPVVLACSSATRRSHSELIKYTGGDGRRLCEDRRGLFDHLRPHLFVKNTVRVVVMQTTTSVTQYYNDQLKEDMEREERIQRGEITRAQANKDDEEWQEVSVAFERSSPDLLETNA